MKYIFLSLIIILNNNYHMHFSHYKDIENYYIENPDEFNDDPLEKKILTICSSIKNIDQLNLYFPHPSDALPIIRLNKICNQEADKIKFIIKNLNSNTETTDNPLMKFKDILEKIYYPD